MRESGKVGRSLSHLAAVRGQGSRVGCWMLCKGCILQAPSPVSWSPEWTMKALVIQHSPAALGPMSVASTPAGPQ